MHPRAVGVFILGALAILLVAIVALSSGPWFARRDRFALYFPGSVKGLEQGSAVTFRGVKVGEVYDVSAIVTGQPDQPVQIEVIVEILGEVVEVPEGQAVPAAFAKSAEPEELAQALVERGVRARLKSASFVTGQKYIDLDFLPGEPARFAGLRPRYPELPTSPTSLEKLGDRAEDILESLAKLPVEQMLDDLGKTLRSAREVFESPELRQGFAAVGATARRMETTLTRVDAALQAAEGTLGALRGEVGPTADEARQTLRGFRQTATRADESLDVFAGTLRSHDDTRLTALRALGELTRTMQALRNLAEYLETHPEALLAGKEKPKEKESE
jgi:paraquat-inducible protein B